MRAGSLADARREWGEGASGGEARPEIAAELYVSFNTVKTHASAIFRKLGAASRDEAVAHPRELGVL